MADYAKVSNVAAADIAKVNNVAKAAIGKVNVCTTPSSGATLWCIVGDDGAVSTAAAADLNDWTGYVSAGLAHGTGSSKPYISIAYGKDPSDGSTVWVATSDDGNREIRYSADPTAGVDAWTDVDDPMGQDMHGVAWGNNVWIAVGKSGQMFRCVVDMDTWVQVDLAGQLTNHNASTILDEVISDGAGNWLCGQDSRLYFSDDDGATWSEAVDLGSASYLNSTDYNVKSMCYTDSKWIVFLVGAGSVSGHTRVFHATDPESTWTAATVDGNAQASDNLVSSGAKRMAAGDGTVIIVVGEHTSRSTNSGADWVKRTSDLSHGDCYDVATDGQGNWVTVHNNGRVNISTNDGDSFAEQTGDQYSGDTRLRFPTGTANIDNLDAVAADVFLPV